MGSGSRRASRRLVRTGAAGIPTRLLPLGRVAAGSFVWRCVVFRRGRVLGPACSLRVRHLTNNQISGLDLVAYVLKASLPIVFLSFACRLRGH